MNEESKKEVVKILFDLEIAFDYISEDFKKLARVYMRDLGEKEDKE